MTDDELWQRVDEEIASLPENWRTGTDAVAVEEVMDGYESYSVLHRGVRLEELDLTRFVAVHMKLNDREFCIKLYNRL